MFISEKISKYVIILGGYNLYLLLALIEVGKVVSYIYIHNHNNNISFCPQDRDYTAVNHS